MIPVSSPGAQGGQRPASPGGDSPTERILLPQAAAAAAAPHGGDATRVGPPPPGGPGGGFGGGRGFGAPPTPPAGGDLGGEKPRWRRRSLLVGALVVALLAVLYVGDLLLSSGCGAARRDCRRCGRSAGSSLAAAEQRLRAEIEPRATQPVPVQRRRGHERDRPDGPPGSPSTGRPPSTRSASSRSTRSPASRRCSPTRGRRRDHGPTQRRSTARSRSWRRSSTGPPTEGTVRFDGHRRRSPVDPRARPAARRDRRRRRRCGASGCPARPVALPLTHAARRSPRPRTSPPAIEEVARPAVSAPVTVIGENGTSRPRCTPRGHREALLVRPGENGGLVPRDQPGRASTDAVAPQLAPSEQPGRDATLDFSAGAARSSSRPRTAAASTTRPPLADLLTVLTGTGPREITAVYADQPAEVTTEDLQALGIPEVIGSSPPAGSPATRG